MTELPTAYQQQTHQTKYSRWREDLGRRELWTETVDRYFQFWNDRLPEAASAGEREWLRRHVVDLTVIPSMRALMTAGPALEKDEVAGYNCAYLTISRAQAFPEIMYLLMCGVGVGYSVEPHHVRQLPLVPGDLQETDKTITVPDSKGGWANSFKHLIESLYAGYVPKVDTSHVRPAGSILKTFGGRASGPAPLERLLRHTVATFRSAAGRQLSTKECHSIACMIADIVVVGGVRRSAMIALFDANDYEMMHAKYGDWAEVNPHFGMANNSAVWNGRPDPARFFKLMKTLVSSQSGEPGIINRQALIRQAERVGRDPNHEFGLNPCGEIILRDRQLCNLSEAIVRPGDSTAVLMDKVSAAAVLGTWQADLTNFRFLSKQWQKNCEDERLLGVSMQNNLSHPVLGGSRGRDKRARLLERLNEQVEKVNAEHAARIGHNPSASRTAMKPSGNSSQLANSNPPLKPPHAKYFIRRTRINLNDPVFRFMRDRGVVWEPEVFHPDTTAVISWPMKAPDGSPTRHDLSALDHLAHWHDFHEHYTDHNPSVTINVRDDEWVGVANFVWDNFDKMSGVAFLPDEDHIYQQAPYEECTKEEYEALLAKTPQSFDWTELSQYEQDDRTTGAQELACVGGVCLL